MSFSFEERARQKALSRARDEERLASGEISAVELQRENCPFRGPKDGTEPKIYFIPASRVKTGKRVLYLAPRDRNAALKPED